MSADKSSERERAPAPARPGSQARQRSPGQQPAAPGVGKLIDDARITGPRRQMLDHGHVAFRSYLTAEIMLAHVTAEALGLSGADFFGLNIVGLRGTVTAGDLAHATGLTSGAATRMIDRLEAAGFVRRLHDTADRRRVLVELAAGREAEIDAVLEPNRRRLAEVFFSYTDEQLSVLFDYFERATPALLAAAEELQSRPE